MVPISHSISTANVKKVLTDGDIFNLPSDLRFETLLRCLEYVKIAPFWVHRRVPTVIVREGSTGLPRPSVVRLFGTTGCVLAECRPHLGDDIRRRSRGIPSAGVHGHSLDAGALGEDSSVPAELDVGGRQVAQIFMVAPVIIVLDERFELGSRSPGRK